MVGKEFWDMLHGYPVVEFEDGIETCANFIYEETPKPGMRARVSYPQWNPEGNLYEVEFTLLEFEAHNAKFGGYENRSILAKSAKHKHRFELAFKEGDSVPVRVPEALNPLLHRFLRAGAPKDYTLWLEEELLKNEKRI